MAEFLGVAVFVIFGAGADAQVTLSTDPNVAAVHKGVCHLFPSRLVSVGRHDSMTEKYLSGIYLHEFRMGNRYARSFRSCYGDSVATASPDGPTTRAGYGRLDQRRHLRGPCQSCGTRIINRKSTLVAS